VGRGVTGLIRIEAESFASMVAPVRDQTLRAVGEKNFVAELHSCAHLAPPDQVGVRNSRQSQFLTRMRTSERKIRRPVSPLRPVSGFFNPAEDRLGSS
jgi:hypothetical protein